MKRIIIFLALILTVFCLPARADLYDKVRAEMEYWDGLLWQPWDGTIRNSSGTIIDTFGADPVGLKNVAETTINPATEEKQDDIISAIEAIPPGGADPVGLKNTSAVAVNPSTSDAQTTGNNSLSSIDGKITACNTGSIAGSVTCNAGTNLNTSALATSALQTTLNGYVDGIEGQLTTIDGRVDGLEGYTDGLEGLITSTNGYVDGLEGLITSTNGYVDGVEASLTAIASNTGNLVWLSSASSDVDNSAVLVFDCSAVSSSAKYISVTNAGTGDLFVRVGGSAPVADGSTAYYDFKLAIGETRWIAAGYKASSTDNDVQVIRAGAQTNDNVIVSLWGYAS